jgi:hypothetical protein
MGAPQAKQFRLVRDMDGEVVVVDDVHHIAHRLTDHAARVWRACDGRAGRAELAVAADISEASVDEIVARLEALGLLEEERPPSSLPTRRAVLRKAVVLGVGLPVVTSVVLPTAAQAFDSRAGGGVSSESNGVGATASGGSPAVQGASGEAGQQPVASRVLGAASHHTGGTHRVGTARPTRPVVLGARSMRTGRQGASHGLLPFTGFRVVQSAAVGLGLVASGIAARIAAQRRPPDDRETH